MKHQNQPLIPENETKLAMRVSVISVIVNLVLSVFKLLAGIFAHSGAIDTVLSHYAGYIRYFSKVHGQVNAEIEEYVKQQLIAALFKFRFDR